MDFDINFGRFFGLEIDTFTEAGSSETVPPKEILNSEKRDFPWENAIFSKIDDFCFDVEIDKNHERSEKKSFQNPYSFGHAF